MLKIENLHVRVAGKDILKGLSLEVQPGQVHAIMGPNGAGKSTLGNVIAGREGYEVVAGSVTFEGRDLLALEPEERAASGVFLAFQYPVEIPGVNNTYFLRTAVNAQRKARGESELDSMQFLKKVREKLAVLHLKDDLLQRAVNEGFSGGEKKRNEIFQLALLEPKLAILDETDSGLDIDALKNVAEGVNALRSPDRAFLVVGDDQEGAVGRTQCIDAFGDVLQRIDVEATVGFVEDRELGFEQGELEDLVALLLAAAEALVDRTLQQVVLEVEDRQFLAHLLQELHRVQLALATRLALRVDGGAQEVGVVHARDLDRVLEGEEHAAGGTLFRLQRKQVATFEGHRTGDDFIAFATSDDIAERGLAGAVWTHDRVHLARLHFEREALEDFLAGDADVEVFDLQHVLCLVGVRRFRAVAAFALHPPFGHLLPLAGRRRNQPTAPSRETSSSFLASTANSIGNSRNTDLQKPSTIIDTASSSLMPRERQ